MRPRGKYRRTDDGIRPYGRAWPCALLSRRAHRRHPTGAVFTSSGPRHHLFLHPSPFTKRRPIRRRSALACSGTGGIPAGHPCRAGQFRAASPRTCKDGATPSPGAKPTSQQARRGRKRFRRRAAGNETRRIWLPVTQVEQLGSSDRRLRQNRGASSHRVRGWEETQGPVDRESTGDPDTPERRRGRPGQPLPSTKASAVDRRLRLP